MTKRLYLDIDTTPALASRYSSGGLESAKRQAFKFLEVCEGGQIGIYENHLGAGFKGYAIRYPGQDSYFEPSSE